jgi:hypothetical protein
LRPSSGPSSIGSSRTGSGLLPLSVRLVEGGSHFRTPVGRA